MSIQTALRQPMQMIAQSPRSTASVTPINPDKVWISLQPEQQQTVFQTIVTMCQSMLSRQVETTAPREDSHE